MKISEQLFANIETEDNLKFFFGSYEYLCTKNARRFKIDKIELQKLEFFPIYSLSTLI